MALVNTGAYVKFIKSTTAAFNALASKNSDTLYFVSDNDISGRLYLGAKLIGGADGGASSLTELADIAIDQLGDNQVLVYNGEEGKWENASIYTAIGVMTGATASTAGKSGLVPVPAAGDNNKFLRGDGTWSQVLPNFSAVNADSVLHVDNTGNLEWASVGDLQSELVSDISSLQEVVTNNVYTKTEVDNAIANAAFLKRRIVASTDAIDLTAEDADRYIYMVRNSNNDGNNLYNEYIVVEDSNTESGYRVELISSGTGSVDLTNYVTTGDLQTELSSLESSLLQDVADNYVTLNQYNTEVGNLSQLIITQNNGNTLVNQMNDLTDRLTWYELNQD